MTVTNSSGGSAKHDFSFQSDLFTQIDFVAGSYTASGYVDGAGHSARMNYVRGVASDGVYLYLAIGMTGNFGATHHLRRVHIKSGAVETFVGDPADTFGGEDDGPFATSQFDAPGHRARRPRALRLGCRGEHDSQGGPRYANREHLRGTAHGGRNGRRPGRHRALQGTRPYGDRRHQSLRFR